MQTERVTDVVGTNQAPLATYRLQFNRHFTLADARKIVPYLRDLGISHIYASPLLKAVSGSMHGYDVCDFQELNPELGCADDLAKLHAELEHHQMGLLLDVVPNHMGIDIRENHWWRDVLTHGQDSRFARCFDIDWNSSDPRLRGKVAVPILTQRYSEALAQGALRLSLSESEGMLQLQYAGQDLPLSPQSVAEFVDRALKTNPDGSATIQPEVDRVNRSPEALDEFVRKQHYLPMFWPNGHSVLNYRRFFTITTLAGIRIEDPWVFEQAFQLVKEWLDRGWVNGLRVDHADGMRHPEEFLRRLREMAPQTWIVVEKILEPGEPLNPHWPVDGTTGYDFLNYLNSLYIDPQGGKPLSDFYAEFTGERLDYTSLVREKRKTTLLDQLAAESARLTDLLMEVSARHWECRDFTRAELRDAWMEVATCIPVYRTYAGANRDPEVTKWDTRLVHAAATDARERRQDLPAELFDFLEQLLLLRHGGKLEEDFVMRFQQLTGPVMAKAVEDTALYCYARLAALNEVGGDPSQFGISAATFHEFCQTQQSHTPLSMAATATHDTKWGGDVRARLALLSERPEPWIQAVRRWSKMNEAKRRQGWPDRRAEYWFYQVLAGAWPLTKERALEYMIKAAREAKEYTRWRQPVPRYEEALKHFVSETMDDSKFMAAVEQFLAPLLDPGWINSLSQTLIKLTATGVPDIYQGADLWDLSLADPDNRRAVDFESRIQLLEEAKKLSAAEVWTRRSSGLPKMWLIWKVLDARRRHPSCFGPGAPYQALKVTGAKAPHVVAFARDQRAVTVAPRLTGSFDGLWQDTKVDLPPGRWRNVLTSSFVVDGRMATLFSEFPAAFLLKEE